MSSVFFHFSDSLNMNWVFGLCNSKVEELYDFLFKSTYFILCNNIILNSCWHDMNQNSRSAENIELFWDWLENSVALAFLQTVLENKYKFWKIVNKIEKSKEYSLDLIPSPSPSVKIQIMGSKGVKAQLCWMLSTNFWIQKVCWQCPAMFCLYASNKLSCP